ncbi:MAG: (2Fe-2S)-binding protein [Pseudomonadales bacterium]|nr:(2Fe-2S)-binding protein [Pseudomonadales bacterium]
MPRVTYRQPDGSEATCEVAVGHSVMDGALDNGVPGIVAQCGGACNCATCHCYVDPPWIARLPPPGYDEAELLGFVWQPRAESRLACQIRISDELDGLVVEVPERQI